MYEREALKAVVESGAPLPLRIVRIKYDQRTGDSLEYLVAAVRALKGHDDYNRVDWEGRVAAGHDLLSPSA